MSAPALEVRGLGKRFGSVVALERVDLTLAPREIVVVLGPTGAGKTTLLRTIAGLEAPDAGSIAIGGVDVASRTPAERDVALVFQNFSLYPGWSVRANLEFPLRAPGRALDEREVAERVARAAEMLRITPLLERDSRRLSGGEMQRVAIGRAIVRRPKLFLMDEPLSNLDAKLRESLRVEIARLVRELGTPMVYVTHDQAEALSIADRIVVLAAGRVLQAGSPREVYLRPSTPQVARQLGSPPINVLAARREGSRWLAEDGASLAGADDASIDRAWIGARPEHVHPRGGDRPAQVLVVEDVGSARVLLVDWAGSRVRLLVDKSLAIAVGDRVEPRIEPGRAIVWPR